MTWAPALLLPTATAAGAAWIFTRSRRLARDPQTLLNRLHKHELAQVERFLSADDLLEADKEFWRTSGRFPGLLRKLHNATLLVQLCQMLCEQASVDPKIVGYLTKRSVLIVLLVLASPFEASARLFVTDLPHLFARTATQLYCDMVTRSKTLCCVYSEANPLIAEQILALL